LSETTDQTSPDPQQIELALVCVVLDEFPQIVTSAQGRKPYSWCLQETAVTVSSHSRAEARRQTTAACVSLSNLQCQRPDRLPPTPLFFAGGRRRRLSSWPPLLSQSVVSDFFAPPSEEDLGAKIAAGRRGAPLMCP
jgi:hypothetical protein